uniref:Uncharacterized protein n=1 Tax=Psilocybe cubensis TaxID=181762 RepID=A0A8H7XQR6_PSICU
MDPFDLSWLIVKHNPDYNGSADLFLPHLEEFEIYDTMASDTTALEFITSRLNPLSHVAVLKSVLIYFNRAKGPDKIEIQELAEAHAVHAGVSLKLHLKYLPPTLELRNPFNFVPPAALDTWIKF